jgi:Dolichyl-phosphate-mannose-protein mannosyltransferase
VRLLPSYSICEPSCKLMSYEAITVKMVWRSPPRYKRGDIRIHPATSKSWKPWLPGTGSSRFGWAGLVVIPLIVVLSVPSLVRFGHHWTVGKDAIRYLFAGSELILGQGLRTSDGLPFNGGHGPAFPVLIGSLILVFGRGIETLAWAVRLLALLNPLLAYFLVKRISSPLAGLIAAALLALFGKMDLAFNIDTVLVTFYLLALLTLLAAIKRNSSALALLSGGLLGISILTKETAVVNVPLALLAVLLFDRDLRAALWHYLGVILTCLPWWIWVYSASGELYLIDRLPSSLHISFVVATATLLVIGTLAYTTGTVARFLGDERRRRWTGWFVILVWTVLVSALALYTGAPALAKASFESVRLYLANLLSPGIAVVPMLILIGGYVLWKAFRRGGSWRLLALALLFQIPVCLLVVVQEWAPRQFLVAQTLVFCALAALIVDAGEAAWRGRGSSTRLAGAMVAVPIVIFLLAASVERAQALLFENPFGGLSKRHGVAPPSTEMVDWMTENVPEGQNVLITPAYSLNRYLVYLDGGRHEWAFLRLDQEPCRPRPNVQMRCDPDENATSRIPPDAVWVHVGAHCKTISLSMSNLLEQVRRTRSGYLMISGGYRLPGIMGLPSRLQQSGAFEVVHSELDHGGASGPNQGLVLLKSTGRAPEAVPTLMEANNFMLRLRRCEQSKGPGYAKRIRSKFPNEIRTRTGSWISSVSD